MKRLWLPLIILASGCSNPFESIDPMDPGWFTVDQIATERLAEMRERLEGGFTGISIHKMVYYDVPTDSVMTE